MRLNQALLQYLAPIALALFGTTSCASPNPFTEEGTGWKVLFDGADLQGWESIPYGGEGDIYVGNGYAHLHPGVMLTGLRYPAGLPVKIDYELQVRAVRVTGTDFFCGLTLPVGDEFATVVLGGWGGGLCGLSCIDGRDASMNESKVIRHFQKEQEYMLIVRVEPDRVRAWVDRELLFNMKTEGKRLSLRPEVLPSAPLGISAFITSAKIGPVRWRSIARP